MSPVIKNYVRTRLNWKLAARTRPFPVIETSVTWGENRAAGISRQEACTGREGHSFLHMVRFIFEDHGQI